MVFFSRTKNNNIMLFLFLFVHQYSIKNEKKIIIIITKFTMLVCLLLALRLDWIRAKMKRKSISEWLDVFFYFLFYMVVGRIRINTEESNTFELKFIKCFSIFHAIIDESIRINCQRILKRNKSIWQSIERNIFLLQDLNQ